MSTVWNPSNPDLAGSEWFAAQAYGRPLSQSLGRGAILFSTQPETIARARAYLTLNAAGHLSGQYAQVGVDIYADTVADVGNSIAVTVPVENVTLGAGWLQYANYQSSGAAITSAAYTFINEPLGVATSNTVALPDALAADGRADTRAMFRGSASWLDGGNLAPVTLDATKRIVSITVSAVCLNQTASVATAQGVLRSGGQDAVAGGQSLNAGDPTRRLDWTWYCNPFTYRQWTIGELAQFLSGGTGAFGVRSIAHDTGSVFVFSISLTVTYAPEHRVATGYANVLTGWNDFTMLAPADHTVAPWAKQGGQAYRFLFYLSGDGGNVDLRHLDGDNVNDGHGNIQSLDNIHGLQWPIFRGGSAVPSAAHDDLGDIIGVFEDQAAPALVLDPGGATFSPNGQPYAQVIYQTIDPSHVANQRVASTATDTYAGINVCVATAAGTAAPLVVTLKLASNGNTVTSAQIAPSQVPADGHFHLVPAVFANDVGLVAGTTYLVEFSSASVPGWIVPMLQTADPVSNKGAAVGIGGNTEYATYGIQLITADFVTNIFTAPDAPTDPITLPLTIDNQPLFLTGCTPATVGYAALSWTATTLGSRFLRYDVQRLALADFFLGTDEWQTIAQLTLEDSAYFSDFECLRNVGTFYRVRVVRTDGAPSPWLNMFSVTVPSGVDVVTLASNLAPTASLAFQYETPEQWAPTDGQKGVVKAISGRDLPAAFRPLERGGDTFSRSLIVAAADPVTEDGTFAGRQLFDPSVLLLADPTLPYIAYCDGHSRRWFTFAQRGAMVRSEPGNSYKAEVTFTEIASTPTVVTIDIPWGAHITPPPPPPPSLLFGDPGGTFGDAGGTFGTQ